jgi:prolyl oligopeptidase
MEYNLKNKLTVRNLILIFFFSYNYCQLNAQGYPPTKTVDSMDIHFGVAYPDPYRWMEDMKNPEVEQWFKAQAEYSNNILSKISGRDELVNEWSELDKLEPDQVRGRDFRGGRLFFRKISSKTNVSQIFYREGKFGKDNLLFDPATYESGKTLSVNGMLPSHDGRYLGIAYTENGAEIGTLRILDVNTKKFLPEVIHPVWGGILEWTFVNKSFLYGKLSSGDEKDPMALKNSKTMIHTLGTDVQSDKDIFSRAKNPSLNILEEEWPSAVIHKDYPEYIIGYVSTVQSEMKMYVAPISELNSGNINWKVVASIKDSINGASHIKGHTIYAATTRGGYSNSRLVRTDLRNPNWNKAHVILDEMENKLEYFQMSKDYLLVVYSDGVNMHLYKMDFNNEKLTKVNTPLTGSIGVYNLDRNTNDFIINISGHTLPMAEYEYNADTDVWQKSRYNETPVYPEKFTNLMVEEVEVKGHDGTMIPLTLVYQKGLKKDGSNVCMMTSYGAYGASMTPYFDPMEASIATKGVILAYPHVRGGSEKGEKWYRAGFKTTKPNTWKDFNSCAEWLIKNGYTSNKKIAGSGTSAGGILITRAITERPDLYAAAICNVGCANALRMEKTPNGPGNVPEFGTVTDSIECRALYEMDGVAHVQYGVNYPATMSVAGYNDPRVIAWQPGKFAAAMQNCSKGDRPSILKVNYDNGHFTEDKKVTWANFADQYAFAMWQCGHPDFQQKDKVLKP